MSKIHRSLIRDEVKDLEVEMSVSELLDHITSDTVLFDINSVLEDIAEKNIKIMRGEIKDNG